MPAEKKLLENYDIYNLNIYELECMDKNRFMYEKYIKFYLLPDKNLFNKYKEVYKNFFYELFLKDTCIKKLFITTFPVLEDIYFINKDLLNFIFDKKIHAFNFENNEFVGMTIDANLDIFLKVNFSYNNDDKIEKEICVFAAFIVILIHELAHFIRIYIYKRLHIEAYEKSFIFDENEEPEIGKFIERKLFGREIGKINIIEAIYILNINNYFKNVDDFLNEFVHLDSKKSIDKIDVSVNDFFDKVGIILSNVITLNQTNELKLKGNKDDLNIGLNNDKSHTSETIVYLSNYMNEYFYK